MESSTDKKNKPDPKAERILAAVSRVLARNGYMGTTINAVAKEAGVSRGLLHYYFSSKDEMLARVIKANMEISIAMIIDVFDQYHTPQGYAEGIVSLLRVVMETDPDFFHLFFEGFAVARQSTVVKDQLTSLYGQFRQALEKGLTLATEQGEISPALPPKALATIITGLVDGMGLQLLTEPELCQDQAIWDAMTTSIEDLLTTNC